MLRFKGRRRRGRGDISDEDLVAIVREFLESSSPDECERLVRQYDVLLSPAAARAAEHLVAAAQAADDAVAVERFRKRRSLLQRCGKVGVDAAFGEVREFSLESRVSLHLASLVVPQTARTDIDWPTRCADLLDQPGLAQLGREDRAMVSSLLGVLMLNRHETTGRLPFLDAAIRCFRDGVERAPAGSVRLSECLDNLAGSLSLRHHLTEEEEDLRGAEVAWRRCCRNSMDNATEQVLDVTYRWARLAAERQAWQEVAEACQFALDAGERLVRSRLDVAGKEGWLERLNGAAAQAAYAFAMLGSEKNAVLALERGRGLILTERLEDDRAGLIDLESQGHLDLARRFRNAAARVRRMQRQPTDMNLPPPGLDAQRAAIAELDSAIAEIRSMPGHADFLAPITFQDISALAADTPIVYLTTASHGGVAFIVRGGEEVRSVLLPELSQGGLRDQTRRILSRAEQRFHACSRIGAAPQLAEYLAGRDILLEMTRWLWDAAVAPLLSSREDLSRVVLIPMGALAVWPLHAAWTEDPTAAGGRRYLLDESCVSYTPNSRTLRQARRTAMLAPCEEILIIEDPRPADGERLEFVEIESEAVASFFSRVTFRRGAEATRAGVLAAIREGNRIVHFNCHGVAEPDDPFASGLPMADRARLTVKDLIDLPATESRLAVLSACETTLPGIALVDEGVSLSGVMLRLGFAGVVAPTQIVPVVSTVVLMARFYELWRESDTDPAEALRMAQRWVRDCTCDDLETRFANAPQFVQKIRDSVAEPDLSHPFRHPHCWAPFSFVGA